ncbi:hypothetical protein [Natronoglomus mannanivorans]|uniref:DUF8160 domain-containing protein n=1 Tax=Natronoglomus mannanivorans TaxID=2979990 RepID=A0AAP2Z2X2_9EURY|nr:hypothetical protein [Halobacteria archaeon AArc-xg1-1]
MSDAEQARDSPTETAQIEEASDTSDADNTSNMSESSSASESSPVSSKPGPDRDENATRHRKQVPMYLPDGKAKQFNELYERLDGRSKVAGEGAIEKHADFMEAVVELAIEREDDIAEKLGIEST